MLTPQDIENISFGRATFGGYDMESVDTFLGPLIDDFTTLYKENALLKNKMKVLVSKLEEYRNNEESMKEAIVNTQKTCDLMIKEAEAKCAQMITDANATAIENAKNANALVAAEQLRVNEARKAAHNKIDVLKNDILVFIEELDRLKTEKIPAPIMEAIIAKQEPVSPAQAQADAMADEISATLQNLIGLADEAEPVPEPKQTFSDTSGKFKDLKFGPNYNPTKR